MGQAPGRGTRQPARLRLTDDDRARLARGDGKLPVAYAEWARQAVEHSEFWEHQGRVWDANGDPVVDPKGRQERVPFPNYLSIDERIPITVVGTHSARATGTNSLHGHVWEDFASQTYKELDAVGPIHYRDPFSGANKSFSPPGGGVGYYRVPTLISVWATAPFFHNNALGDLNNDPSAKGRLASFDDSIDRLLWPERRQRPSEQHYWPGAGAPPPSPTRGTRGRTRPWRSRSRTRGGIRPTTPATGPQLSARLDGGWVWRTTRESWFTFNAPHVPMLVGGVVGLSREQMQILAFLPALAFLGLGTGLLLSGRLNSIWNRIGRRLTWLAWLLGPFRWLFSVGGLALALASGYFVLYRFRPAVALLDVGTGGAIPWFRLQAFLIPVLLFGSAGLLFLPFRVSRNRALAFTARVVGVACLVLAVTTAMGIGRTLAGMGADVKIGPIPEGVPVNIVASIDPLASRNDLVNAGDALVDFLSKHQDAAIKNPGDEGAKAARRREFQEKVAPLLLRASKCPDFVIDRGHDYVFIRDFTDQEKRELIALHQDILTTAAPGRRSPGGPTPSRARWSMLEIPDEWQDRDRTPIDFIVVGAGRAAHRWRRGWRSAATPCWCSRWAPSTPTRRPGMRSSRPTCRCSTPPPPRTSDTPCGSSSSTSTTTRREAGTGSYTAPRMPVGTRWASSTPGPKAWAGARSTTP